MSASAQFIVRRYYFNPNGMCINEREAPFENEAAARKYLAMLRGTIKRQNDNSLAGLYGPDGKCIKVD